MGEPKPANSNENPTVAQALRESQTYLMNIIATAMDAIITIDQDQNILIFNRAAEQMFGYSAEIIQGQTVQVLLPERYRERHSDHIRRFGEMGVTNRSMGRLGTLYGLRSNGDEFPIEASISKIIINGTLSYTVILRDVTERMKADANLQVKTDEIKSMTQQLWQTAKLATMGELAASIAHELNNPLAILSLRIESLKMKMRTEAAELHELSIMEKEVDRMASLVANLLQFSRSSERQMSTLDLREEVEKTLELVNNHLAHRQIIVKKQFSPALPMVIVDRQQIRQLFLNLFSNASDAMPDGGTLYISLAPSEDRQAVLIEIRDTGVGIPAENLEQLTEPFFTTKKDGKGTGLGLSICRRITEEYSGSLQIYSPGINQGATFRIVLPVAGYSTPSID